MKDGMVYTKTAPKEDTGCGIKPTTAHRLQGSDRAYSGIIARAVSVRDWFRDRLTVTILSLPVLLAIDGGIEDRQFQMNRDPSTTAKHRIAGVHREPGVIEEIGC